MAYSGRSMHSSPPGLDAPWLNPTAWTHLPNITDTVNWSFQRDFLDHNAELPQQDAQMGSHGSEHCGMNAHSLYGPSSVDGVLDPFNIPSPEELPMPRLLHLVETAFNCVERPSCTRTHADQDDNVTSVEEPSDNALGGTGKMNTTISKHACVLQDSKAKNRSTLVVAYFPRCLKQSELRSKLEKFGDLKKVHIVRDDAGTSRCYAFVYFRCATSAAALLNACKEGQVTMNDLMGKPWYLKADWAKQVARRSSTKTLVA